MRIGIIGAGPRGLSVLERLLYNQRQEDIEILLFDPSGIGGKVWRVDQPKEVLINSLSSQVTMFTDEALSSGGLVANGVNLYQWAKEFAPSYLSKTTIKEKEALLREATNLLENQPTSRRFFGAYLQWFYDCLQERFSDHFDYIQELVIEATKKEKEFIIQTKDETYVVDQLILATGHWEHEPTTEESRLSEYAAEHHLFCQKPANPANVNLSLIPAQEPVFIRGLGLCFFDYIGLLTQQRGGRFEEYVLSY